MFFKIILLTILVTILIPPSEQRILFIIRERQLGDIVLYSNTIFSKNQTELLDYHYVKDEWISNGTQFFSGVYLEVPLEVS